MLFPKGSTGTSGRPGSGGPGPTGLRVSINLKVISMLFHVINAA